MCKQQILEELSQLRRGQQEVAAQLQRLTLEIRHMATTVTALDSAVTAEGTEISTAVAQQQQIIEGIQTYLEGLAGNPSAADVAAQVALLQQQTAALHASNVALAAAVANATPVTPVASTTAAPVAGTPASTLAGTTAEAPAANTPAPATSTAGNNSSVS